MSANSVILPIDPATATGPHLAAALAERHPHEDWLAALAKGAVMSRGDVKRILLSEAPLPQAILDAVVDLERMLIPPDPSGTDDLFEARTNDGDARMEVDGEAGLHTVPSPKPHPSRSNSLYEQGVREEDRENNDY